MLLAGEVGAPEEDDLVLEEGLVDGFEVEFGVAEVDADDLSAQRSRDSPNLHAALLAGSSGATVRNSF